MKKSPTVAKTALKKKSVRKAPVKKKSVRKAVPRKAPVAKKTAKPKSGQAQKPKTSTVKKVVAKKKVASKSTRGSAKKPAHRPPIWTETQIQITYDYICLLIATTPKGLEHLLKTPKEEWPEEMIKAKVTTLPCPAQFYTWKMKPGFLERYVQARTHQQDVISDQIIMISDGTAAFEDTPEGHRLARRLDDSVHVNRDRLRVDTRHRIMKVLNPTYSDKSQIDHHVFSHEDALEELK